MSRVYEIADDYVERLAALHPIAATRMGVPGYEDQLTDFSPAGHEARIALDRDTLAALERAPLENDRDRVAREAMTERLRLALELDAAGDQHQGLNILTSPLQSIRRVFDLMPRDTEEHWHNIALRLTRLPEALSQFRETLETGIERELVGTRRQVEACAEQAEAWSGHHGDEPGFFRTLVGDFETSGVDSPGLAAELDSGAGAAGGAYAAFARYLRQRYLAVARPRDAVGRDRYALGARVHNGADLDLRETYDWGWQELRRIERELDQTAEQILPGGGVEAAKDLLERDPDRAIEGVDEFQRWMQELQDSTIAEAERRAFRDRRAPCSASRRSSPRRGARLRCITRVPRRTSAGLDAPGTRPAGRPASPSGARSRSPTTRASQGITCRSG